MPQTYKLSTEHGRTLCRTILRECMPHDTHDFQLEAMSYLLDSDDVLLLTATGTGKTDTFIRTMHVIRYLTENHASAPEGVSFPHDPAMIIVCPTKALEEEMVSNMTLQLAEKLSHH